MNRRHFILSLATSAPLIVAPPVAYSFLWGNPVAGAGYVVDGSRYLQLFCPEPQYYQYPREIVARFEARMSRERS